MDVRTRQEAEEKGRKEQTENEQEDRRRCQVEAEDSARREDRRRPGATAQGAQGASPLQGQSALCSPCMQPDAVSSRRLYKQ